MIYTLQQHIDILEINVPTVPENSYTLEKILPLAISFLLHTFTLHHPAPFIPSSPPVLLAARDMSVVLWDPPM